MPNSQSVRPLLVSSLVLALGAAALLVAAKVTPWHTNSDAYFAGLAAAGSDANAFYANLHRYETRKWIYADIGYAAAVWSVALLILAEVVDRHGWRVVTRTNADSRLIAGMTLAACGLMLAGWLGQGAQQLGRWEVYDGSTGPMAVGMWAMIVFMLIGTFLFLVVNLAPLIWKPVAGESLLLTEPLRRGVIISLLYVPFLCLPLFSLIASFCGPGGWGMSLGAVIAIWLILNARALAMGAKAYCE
jgi:hypothetical protein